MKTQEELDACAAEQEAKARILDRYARACYETAERTNGMLGGPYKAAPYEHAAATRRRIAAEYRAGYQAPDWYKPRA
ncbi:MAG: hypothetical protein HYV27_15250 [Candidatus Hydrogenedentes bacterium]|nr:hypothetical protein [Candidatus Hydrogenedentota bacterium]